MKRILIFATLALSLTLFSGASNTPTARGLVLIPLLNARYPVEQAYSLLKELPHPAFAFDSLAFGSKWGNFNSLVTRLSSGAKPVTVVVYGDCGPCRAPRRPAGMFRLVAPKLNIAQLNESLAHSQKATLGMFVKHFTQVERHLPQIDGVRYYFTISLEDNFSNDGYTTLARLAKRVFTNRSDVVISRSLQNPTQHKPREYHSYSLDSLAPLRKGDVVTGDGDNLQLSDRSCGDYSTSYVTGWLDAAAKKGIIAMVWTPEMSGFPKCQTVNQNVTQGPNQRIYSIPYLLKEILNG